MKNSTKIINEYEKRKIDEFFAKTDVVELLLKLKEAATEDDNTFTGLAISTEHVDRMGEIVRQDGIDTEMYMKNPVVLNSHNYYGIENIVGMTTKLYAGLVGDVKATFADGVFAPTEAGAMAKALWKAKCLSAASVGFIPEEFDKDDSRIITKSQLLEYSLVPVPANGWATHQDGMKMLADLGITGNSLRAKGFEIKREPTGEAQAGDECSMEDGTIGSFSDDGHGKLVCIPKQDAMKAIDQKTTQETGGDNDPSKASMWEDLKAEHAFHEKAVKGHIKEYTDAMDAEDEKKPEEGKEDEHEEKRVKAMADHEKKLKTVLKAEHERHIKCVTECYKSYGKKPDSDGPEEGEDTGDESEKMIAALKAQMPFLSDEQLAVIAKTVKAAGTISDAMHKKLTELCESMEEGHGIHTKAIDEFKSLLAAHEPTEGDEASNEDPEKRSTPAVAPEMPNEALVKLARELSTATRDALTRFNHAQSRKG